MVSLADTSALLREAREDAAMSAFARFFLADLAAPPAIDNLIDTNRIIICLLASIKAQNRAAFSACVETLNRRNPQPDSDWLFNEPLLFSLVIACLHFHESGALPTKLLTLRRGIAQDGTTRELGETLLRISERRFEYRGSLGFVSLVAASLQASESISADDLTNVYRALLALHETPAPASLFHRILQQRALTEIVSRKGLADHDSAVHNALFVTRFRNRIRLLSQAFTGLLLLPLFCVTAYAVGSALGGNRGPLDEQQYWFGGIGLSGAFGFLVARKPIVSFFTKAFYSCFGFSEMKNGTSS